MHRALQGRIWTMLIPKPRVPTSQKIGFSHPELANQEREQTKPGGPGGRTEWCPEKPEKHTACFPLVIFPAPTAVKGKVLKFKSEPSLTSLPACYLLPLPPVISGWLSPPGENDKPTGKVINFQFYFKIYQMGDFIGAINMSRAMLVCDGRCPLLGASLPV